MKSLLHCITRFMKADEGPTAVEYAMLVLLIVLACLSAIVLVGQTTGRSYDSSAQEIEAATHGGR